MIHKSLNQKGFGVIEVLLVLVIAGIVGGTGYYVYKANNNSTNTQNSAQTDANTAAPHKKTDTKPTVQYLTISEWGVRAPVSDTLKLQYALSSDGKKANFTSAELLAVDPACTAQYGGSISRFAPTDKTESGQTAQEFAATSDKSTHAYIGGYYYFFTHSQAGCGADTGKTVSLQQQTNNTVKALVSKLQAVPKS